MTRFSGQENHQGDSASHSTRSPGKLCGSARELLEQLSKDRTPVNSDTFRQMLTPQYQISNLNFIE